MKRLFSVFILGFLLSVPAWGLGERPAYSYAFEVSGEACCLTRGGVCGCTSPKVTICCNGTAVDCDCP